MQLFYTGAKAPEATQSDPTLSLGGYKSSSLIPNGTLHNLFPIITKSSVLTNRKDIRMLVLSNTTSSTVDNVTIWTMSQIYSKLKIAAVGPALEVKCNLQYFETVQNNTLPFQAILEQHEGESNALVVGPMAAGDIIGIWIQRELDITKFEDINPVTNSQIDCEACIAALQQQENSGNTTSAEDEIQVFFNWN